MLFLSLLFFLVLLSFQFLLPHEVVLVLCFGHLVHIFFGQFSTLHSRQIILA